MATVAAKADDIATGRQLFYDSRTARYLCSVSEDCFDDGSVSAYRCDTAAIDFTCLPIVRLHGTFSNDYSSATIDLSMPDGTRSEAMLAKVKWRGASTNADGKHKRNYTLKFLGEDGKKQDRKFFGLRNDNTWILDAAQVDLSRIRNRVATDLWNDFAAKPYYYQQEPKALTGTRGQFVELFLDDEYRGIYCMTENIDRSQLKLKKYEEGTPPTLHGMLWKSAGFTYSNFWGYGDYDNTLTSWGSLETKYPDPDDVMPTDYSTIYNAVRFICDSSDDDIRQHAAEYFDLPVVADYFILINLLYAIDNVAGYNCFWACYDQQQDKRLTMAVWDLDATTGQHPNPKLYHPDNVNAARPDTMLQQGLNWALWRTDTPGFRDYATQHYQQLRTTLFSLDSLQQRYHTYMDLLTKAGAYRREAERWSGDSDICGNTLDFEAERQYIDQWLADRLPMLDTYVFPAGTGINGISDVTAPTPTPSATATYDILGRRLPSGAVLRPGLYIRNGRKIIIR